MAAIRKDPAINTKRAVKPEGDSMGCIRFLVIVVVLYFVLRAIARVISGYASNLDHLICYGTLIFFVYALVIEPGIKERKSKTMDAETQKWMNSCKSAKVSIVSRSFSRRSTYEDEYGVPRSYGPSWYLELEMIADQKAAAPNETIVRLTVDGYIYNLLENRDAARIYYEPESPLTFLLEEEL